MRQKASPLDPFVLFAQARSGSSNLLKALQLNPQLQIAEEPLHEKYREWHPEEPKYIDLIKDIASLEEQLSKLYARYNGIKVLDYQLPEEIYTHLLLRPNLKVIVLRRQNILQQIVSGFIAEQTKIWKMWDLKGDIADIYKNLKPINLQEIKKRIEYGDEIRQFYSEVMFRKPMQMHINLIYEEFYTDDVALNRKSISTIFDFLGVSLPNSPKLDNLLNPQVSKINKEEMYAFLPNANEINEKFGCERNGWLF